MSKVNAQHVMALRRLTDWPVSICRDALDEAGDGLAGVLQRLRESPCCGLHASDAEVTEVLAAHGLTFTPVMRQPVILPDSEVVAELKASGLGIADYFLIGGLICSVNSLGELMGCRIDDEDYAASAKSYLRRMGVPEYTSIQAYEEQR